MAVALPFKPYPHQRQAHALRARSIGTPAEAVAQDTVLERGGALARFLVLVWHRRAGKTVFSVMELFLAALMCTRERGRFAYIAPFLKQARAVAWDYLKLYASCVDGCVISESELAVTMPNGAQVRLYGADNPDALRGIYLDGVVLDEVADMKRQVWGEIIRPALADRIGWAIFIGTPKGVNLFSELFFRAQTEPGWKADLRRAQDTGVIALAELEQARREMAPAAFAQEFECDFAAAVDDVLIRLDDILAAQRRTVPASQVLHSPKVLGVDVARYGDDKSCIFPRQGVIAFQQKVFRGLNLMDLAGQVAQVVDRWRPDATFVDAGGMGAGVIDRLLQLNIEVIPVDFGGKSTDPRFENKRAEIWWEMAEWTREGGCLPSGQDLVQDLSAPRYTYRNARGKLQLESKDSMRERGLPSPDVGDALACTFASPVVPKAQRDDARGRGVGKAADYDPYREDET